MVDARVAGLNETEFWREDSVLAFQRCRLFLMVRFPHLPCPFDAEVLSRELSWGEERLCGIAKRILRDLSGAQRKQLAGLVLDIELSLEAFARHGRNSKMVRELAATGDRRLRVLSRRVIKIRSELSELIKYTKRLHPVLQQGHLRSLERSLETLEKLRVDPSFSEFYRSQIAEYPELENPKQLALVQLYWFFHAECKCTGPESEVRAAMVSNEFFGLAIKYIPKYRIDRSMGSSGVRQAVMRFHPRTIE
jgi:hypothetical protein